MMKPSLNDFFAAESKRVHTPGPYFTSTVMARMSQAGTPVYDIWDAVPASSRPVFAVALALMLVFFIAQATATRMPDRGFLDALVEEPAFSGAVLHSSADIPSDQEFLERLMGFEESK